jgi:type II secretory pathway component GspD/PulD (secretin)
MSVKINAALKSIASNPLPTLVPMGAAAVAAPMLLAPAVMAGQAGSTNPIPTVQTAKQGLDLSIAQKLAAEGKLVRARAEGLSQLKQHENTLTNDQRSMAVDLIKSFDTQIGKLPECEVSLQKAELFVQEGDLRMAQRHADAVMNRADASEGDQTRAKSLLSDVAAARKALAPQVPGMISDAAKFYEAGDPSAARLLLTQVFRSGVELSKDDRLLADTYQIKLMELDAQVRGGAIALAQPGTVKRDPAPSQPAQPSQPAPASEPATQPASEPLPAMTPINAEPTKTEPVKTEPVKTEPVKAEPAKADPAPAPTAEATPAPAAEAPKAEGMNPAPAPAPEKSADLMQLAMKADAQRTLAEADIAFDGGRYAEAFRKYQLATTAQREYLSADELARADRRLAECKVRLRDNTGGTLADDLLDRQRLTRERATAEFTNQIDEAARKLAAGNTTDARNLTAGADVTIKNASSYFSQAEIDAFSKKVADLNGQIAQAEEAAKATAATEREAKLKADADLAQARLKEEKERRIVDALNRVRDLQKEQKYNEALQIVDQVLYLDPNNPTAHILRDAINDVRQYQLYAQYKRLTGRGVQQAEMDTHEALRPPLNLMDFPTDWPAKTYLRTEMGGAMESPENRRAMASLESKKIPVQFKGVTLDKALAYIAQNTQVDVTPNWESLKSIGVEPTARVNLSLINDVSAKTALQRVLDQLKTDGSSRVDWAVNDGIVSVASAETIKRQTSTLTYNITDLLLEVPDYKDVPELDLARVLARKADLDTRSGPFAKATQRDERNERLDRIRRISDLIQRTVDPESWRETGGDTGSISEINGTLVITQTPRNHAAITGLLSKLREIRSMQINIESRFLLVSQDYFEQIGFNLSVYFNVGSNQVTNAQTNDPSILPSDLFNFTSGSNGGLRRQVTGQGTTTAAPAGPPVVGTQAIVPPNKWSPIGVGGNSFGLAQGLVPAAGFARDVLSSAPALGIGGQFLDDIQVDFLLKATQVDRRTVTLTAPRLTLTNGQTSNVYVVTQRAIVTDLEPITSDSAVGFDPTTGTVSEGVVMLVEAVVSNDRRYVTMNIDTSINTIREIANQAISAVVGGTLVNSATTSSFIQLPVVTTTRVQTTSTVPDEGTLLLGGQRVVTEIDIETGVPVLSKIPIINRFFTNRLLSKEESTLMILVKPTIIIQTEEEEKNFPGLMDSARTGLGG